MWRLRDSTVRMDGGLLSPSPRCHLARGPGMRTAARTLSELLQQRNKTMYGGEGQQLGHRLASEGVLGATTGTDHIYLAGLRMQGTAERRGGDLVLIQEATVAKLWCRVITGSHQRSRSLLRGDHMGHVTRCQGHLGSHGGPRGTSVRSSNGCGVLGPFGYLKGRPDSSARTTTKLRRGFLCRWKTNG